MTSRRHWGWQLLLSCTIMGGAIAESRDYATAQITPDSTLGRESSIVTSPNLRSFQIGGGATRGTNLFHSFSQFSVPTGGSAYFNNEPSIQNIISRVTGSSVSNIDGLIRANGNANLFLINPNGIIFGPNASLSIGGSFVASTATGLKFADGTLFSATDSQTPPLLTISVPIGLQYGTTIGSIVNQSTATDSNGLPVGLQVQPGNTLALVGGEVTLDGGILQAPGGRVELGGVAGIGTVGLSINGQILSLSFPLKVTRADVSIVNNAGAGVNGGGGGSIAINARNVEILGGGSLLAGTDFMVSSVNAQPGNIEINATDKVTIGGINTIGDPSAIINSVGLGAIGKGGDINIQAKSVSVTNGAFLSTSTSGQGDAGTVRIRSTDTVSFDTGAIFSMVQTTPFGIVGMGKGGDIDITTGSLSITNHSLLQTSSYGQGDAGNVMIRARYTVLFDKDSSAMSTVEQGGMGKGGNIDITTGSLSVANGSQLLANSSGYGDAGSVNINARDRVSFDGVDSDGYASGAFSAVVEQAKGNGGNVNIITRSLSVTNGAQLQALTNGQGNAGNVMIRATDNVSFDGVDSNGASSAAFSTVERDAVGNGGNVDITTRSLSVTNGAGLAASTRGHGNAGNVTIHATDNVSFDGVGSNGFYSGADSRVEQGAVGNGGYIDITTRSLSVSNHALLQTSTAGQGNAGNVMIHATDTASFDRNSAAMSTVEQPGAVGNGGNIEIATRDLVVTDGAQLQALTRGQGNAGSVTIHADTVSFNGVGSTGDPSAAASTVEAGSVGKGGGIDITARSLLVNNGALLSASSAGNGGAGGIKVKASSILLNNRASLSADTDAGQGNITLQSGNLILRHGSDITTNATGTATGGNIIINTENLVAILNEDSDISANAQDSFGGRVVITAKGIFGIQFRPQDTPLSDITATSALGPQFNGTVQLNTIGIDPSHGLTNLPIRPVEPKVAQVCRVGASENQSQFVVTGRGGLPPNPQEALSRDAVHLDWVTLNPTRETRHSRAQEQIRTMRAPLVEAQGWVINNKGQVVLIAQSPTVTPHGSWHKPSGCGVPKSVLIP